MFERQDHKEIVRKRVKRVLHELINGPGKSALLEFLTGEYKQTRERKAQKALELVKVYSQLEKVDLAKRRVRIAEKKAVGDDGSGMSELEEARAEHARMEKELEMDPAYREMMNNWRRAQGQFDDKSPSNSEESDEGFVMQTTSGSNGRDQEGGL